MGLNRKSTERLMYNTYMYTDIYCSTERQRGVSPSVKSAMYISLSFSLRRNSTIRIGSCSSLVIIYNIRCIYVYISLFLIIYI